MKWHISGPGSNYTNLSTDQWYDEERNGNAPSGASKTWDGKVGLIYPSDFGYIYANGVGTACYNKLYDSNECTKVKDKNWFWQDANIFPWTITPRSDLSSSGFYVGGAYGRVGYNRTSNSYVISPVIYLKSDIMIKSGTGQQNDPYILK